MSQVTPFLFIGDIDNARNYSWLYNNGVTHVVNVAMELPNFHPEHFGYLKVPLDDALTQELGGFLDICYAFMLCAINTRGKVLVHCHMGISRSASVVIYFLMRFYKISYDEAFKILKSKRKIVQPNDFFVSQLRELDTKR